VNPKSVSSDGYETPLMNIRIASSIEYDEMNTILEAFKGPVGISRMDA
jgi:hypothetical protein